MNNHAKKDAIARGETFDEFLGRQGLLAESEELAIKELIAGQIKSAMAAEDARHPAPRRSKRIT